MTSILLLKFLFLKNIFVHWYRYRYRYRRYRLSPKLGGPPMKQSSKHVKGDPIALTWKVNYPGRNQLACKPDAKYRESSLTAGWKPRDTQ